MLERLLRSAHYPSLGQYKERLLADTIRGFLPASVDVGTGFVIFPHADATPVAPDHFDPLNQSAYSVSRQCDILVYDRGRFPPIFRDGDFAVVRPESVRAMIEVKGSLSVPATRKALESFDDFGRKWRTTQLFYREHHQAMTPKPGLYLMAWDFQRRTDGHAVTNPTRVAGEIAAFYRDNVSINDADGYPYLRKLLVHNECEVTAIHGLGNEDEVRDTAVEPKVQFGWTIQDGRFVRADPDGALHRDRDRTIASLLASLHWDVGQDDFNRFFSYTDEVRGNNLTNYPHNGAHWAYTGLVSGQARQLTSHTPRKSSDN